MSDLTPEQRIARLRAQRGQAPVQPTPRASAPPAPLPPPSAAHLVVGVAPPSAPPLPGVVEATPNPASVSFIARLNERVTTYAPRPAPGATCQAGRRRLLRVIGFLAMLPMMGPLTAAQADQQPDGDSNVDDPTLADSGIPGSVPTAVVPVATVDPRLPRPAHRPTRRLRVASRSIRRRRPSIHGRPTRCRAAAKLHVSRAPRQRPPSNGRSSHGCASSNGCSSSVRDSGSGWLRLRLLPLRLRLRPPLRPRPLRPQRLRLLRLRLRRRRILRRPPRRRPILQLRLRRRRIHRLLRPGHDGRSGAAASSRDHASAASPSAAAPSASVHQPQRRLSPWLASLAWPAPTAVGSDAPSMVRAVCDRRVPCDGEPVSHHRRQRRAGPGRRAVRSRPGGPLEPFPAVERGQRRQPGDRPSRRWSPNRRRGCSTGRSSHAWRRPAGSIRWCSTASKHSDTLRRRPVLSPRRPTWSTPTRSRTSRSKSSWRCAAFGCRPEAVSIRAGSARAWPATWYSNTSVRSEPPPSRSNSVAMCVCGVRTGPAGHGRSMCSTLRDRIGLLTRLELTEGAIATSSVLGHTWTVDDRHLHHLIDPSTGQPSETDVLSVTTTSSELWWAEVVAKVAVLAGSRRAPAVMRQYGCSGVVLDRAGALVSVVADQHDALQREAQR